MQHSSPNASSLKSYSQLEASKDLHLMRMENDIENSVSQIQLMKSQLETVQEIKSTLFVIKEYDQKIEDIPND